ncbi:MAG: MBL fold metallo-hydrolase [Gammaproteobacteria bacterium TMED78]|nr:MAG: MBL fold metallo-hydrolase [Gammaproteobacteria bacterium TMED78]|tara:strand:- start:693 stop:1577 length:885 start_codon:yes stop_codon:yes gene_type:complete
MKFFFILLLFYFSSIFAQDRFAQVQIETISVSEGVYMLIGAGGNIGLSIGEDGIFMIDDQYAPLSEKILSAVSDIDDREIKFLVNTHYHGDHTGGNEAIGEQGALIIAHENVRERMSTDQFRAIFDQTIPASSDASLPVVTFTDELTFHWNEDTIRVIHVAPAHTDGDSILHFEKANVIHMGDNFFNGYYPFIDVGSGGDINGIISAGYQALSLANGNTKIIPGHGPLSDAIGLSSWLDMLKVARTNMQNLINQGLSEDQALAARPTSEFDDSYGGGFMNPENFNRLLYQSLSN